MRRRFPLVIKVVFVLASGFALTGGDCEFDVDDDDDFDDLFDKGLVVTQPGDLMPASLTPPPAFHV